MQLRPILLAVGTMTALLGLAMVPCVIMDLADGREEWPVFAISGLASIVIGATTAMLAAGDRTPHTGQREAFLMTVLVWLVLSAIGAIPFFASGMGFTDAVFESVSGLTTTGATVITGLDDLPRGLLLWRAILQWIGGIGIIVTAIAILPQLRVGGMQLFQVESSDTSGKFLPRVTEIATQTGVVYLVLSVLCAIAYFANGMTPFDAVAHAMTTMSAGGFSTHDASFGYFGNGVISVSILFMILAALPFASFVIAVRGQPSVLLTDPQPRLLIGFIVVASVTLLLYNAVGAGTGTFDDMEDAIRVTSFNVISVMTGTGYSDRDYSAWGPAAQVVFLGLMFLGGCSGSAACGIKMFRLEISARAVVAYVQKMTQPHRVVPIRYGGRVIDEDTLQSVMVFVFIYLASFVVAAVLLSLYGESPITAISTAATMVSNVGPGLGPEVGPVGTFQTLDPESKWVCIIAMLLGRLEFIAVFVLLTRRFWRD